MTTFTKNTQQGQQFTKPAQKQLKLTELPITAAAAKEYGIGLTELNVILSSVVPSSAADFEIAHLLYHAKRTGLDPLARQIYLVSRSGKCTVQTGIDGYRLIADRTGQYAGNSDPLYDEGLTQYAFKKSERKTPTTATITVRKIIGGVICDFTATAEWDAYYPGDAQGYMWKKMGMLMLAKCAEALALRKAFPAQLSGIYISEEMMQAGESEGDIAEEKLLGDLGVLNKNAIAVKAQLEKVGLDPNDDSLVSILGTTIDKVPNTAEGSDLLGKVWAFATVYAKSKDKDAALESLVKSL